MKKTVVYIALFSTLYTYAYADPLANARLGQVECYSPDRSGKTCHAISSYIFEKDKILNQSEMVVSPSQRITMIAVTAVTIHGEAVCGQVQSRDVESATFFHQGQIVTGDQLAHMRSVMLNAMGPGLNKNLCTTYEPKNGLLIAHATVDGVARPDLNDAVIWVRPNDGYRVSP